MILTREGVLDVVSLTSQRDTCLVLPTLKHAINQWQIYKTAVTESHSHYNNRCVQTTKTSCLIRCTHTVLRLWVPYERDPTMPLDFIKNRKGFFFVSPYGKGVVK